MNRDGLVIPEKTVAVVVDELAYRAKLNKPSEFTHTSTSEWDRMVEIVALAMKATSRA